MSGVYSMKLAIDSVRLFDISNGAVFEIEIRDGTLID